MADLTVFRNSTADMAEPIERMASYGGEGVEGRERERERAGGEGGEGERGTGVAS